MKKIIQALVTHLGELAVVAGVGLVIAGAALIYVPAGLIAGGALALLCGVLSVWADGGDESDGGDQS